MRSATEQERMSIDTYLKRIALESGHTFWDYIANKDIPIIRNWEELSKLPPSETHYLKINLEMENGRVYSKETDKVVMYLSTHTFYKKTGTPYILQDYGWDIELRGEE